MNLPNKLTISRIFLTFVFMLFLFGHGLVAKVFALLVFLAASLTDFSDGYLARKYNMITDFGKLMDPIADKILVLSVFLAFIELELVPAWMVAIIVLRELTITGLRLLALTKKVVLPANEGGKHKTASQMTAIFVILLSLILKEIGMKFPLLWTSSTEIYFRSAVYILMFITTALTLISGSCFLYRNRTLFRINNGKY
jgi:CDP-diacylglycerol---glycerol-3-phosphate 3-phosphatidyltransferase